MPEYSSKIVAEFAGVHPVTMRNRILKLTKEKKFKRKHRNSLTPDEVVKLARLEGFYNKLPDELRQ
jgi:transcription initiation factor TFIIIB Brf1 subunit/transcription initiation factor TFIIB